MKIKEKNNCDFFTISQLCKINNVTRQSIYLLLKRGRLRGQRIKGIYQISKEDIENYMKNRYSRQYSMCDGQLIFDKEKGLHSVKDISLMYGITLQRIYYDLRMNRIPYKRKGSAYVIDEKDLFQYNEILERSYKRKSICI